MKKYYQNPRVEVVEVEMSNGILNGSNIDIGGSGTFDTSHKKNSGIWDDSWKKSN